MNYHKVNLATMLMVRDRPARVPDESLDVAEENEYVSFVEASTQLVAAGAVLHGEVSCSVP